MKRIGLTSRRQTLIFAWKNAFVNMETGRLEKIEKMIHKEIKSAKSTLKQLHEWAKREVYHD